jgi:hypothetical protein
MVDPYDTRRAGARFILRLRALGVAVACAVALVLIGVAAFFVYDMARPPDIGLYATSGVVIVGVTDEPLIVTPADLMALDCTGASATGSGSGQMGESKAGTVKAYGPYLEDFLALYGCSMDDFRRIRVMCKDGYSVILRPELLEGEPILSVADGKEALSAYQRPLRLVIPGEETGKWAFGVLRMEFTR